MCGCLRTLHMSFSDSKDSITPNIKIRKNYASAVNSLFIGPGTEIRFETSQIMFLFRDGAMIQSLIIKSRLMQTPLHTSHCLLYPERHITKKSWKNIRPSPPCLHGLMGQTLLVFFREGINVKYTRGFTWLLGLNWSCNTGRNDSEKIAAWRSSLQSCGRNVTHRPWTFSHSCVIVIVSASVLCHIATYFHIHKTRGGSRWSELNSA